MIRPKGTKLEFQIRIAAIGLFFWIGVLNASQSQSQTTPELRFEVASIRPSPYEDNGFIGIRTSGNQLIVQHRPVAELITYAYDIQDYQLSGGPSWLYSRNLYGPDVYAVSAKAPGESVPTREQFRLMLRALLAERFKLRLHRETRELPAYVLVIGPKGSTLKESAPDPSKPPAIWKSGQNESYYDANAVPITSLIGVLQSVTDKPVINKTGLNGIYKFNLHYANLDSVAADSTAPSIFTAVQEQLGLKLESVKAPFETIVIDSVERPSEN